MVSEVSPSLSDSTDRPGEPLAGQIDERAKAAGHRLPVSQDGGYHVEQCLAAIPLLDFGELGVHVEVPVMFTMVLILLRYFLT